MESVIALIGFGEAGSTFAKAAGWESAALAFDINPARRAVMEEAGVVICGSAEDALGDADVVLLDSRDRALAPYRTLRHRILMLSGIGDANALQEMGIQVKVNAPEVGKNLQDHFMVRFAYRTKPCGTLNEIMANPIRAAGLGLEWALRRKGQMAVGASEASLFARVLPGSEEPEVQFQFVNFSLGGNQGTSANSLAKHPGFTFNFCVCRPDSRGDLTLRSPNVADKPVIRANYLTAPSDIRIMDCRISSSLVIASID